MLTARFPRSASAYENAVCEDEFDDDDKLCTSTSFFESANEEKIAVETETIEVNVPRDAEQPNGIAFRMVGSRSRGVFIDFVHSKSPQSGNLREGDRLLRCNKISLRAVSVDQAASIFRFWMNRVDCLVLLVERRADGESVMLKRRRQARLSMCNEQNEQQGGHVLSGRATLRLTSSKSAEVFRCHNEQPIFSSFHQKTPQYESFDTSACSSGKSICPQCNSQTRLFQLYLHQFSHDFVNNAFRFLTVSRSNYSLL
ncbi:unnamed protein product [Caenorhabditis sp. 36 PRJEB53466]|nr:unnamed protein product [Caenorhabditis sp. 36 PRJEB53466]